MRFSLSTFVRVFRQNRDIFNTRHTKIKMFSYKHIIKILNLERSSSNHTSRGFAHGEKHELQHTGTTF